MAELHFNLFPGGKRRALTMSYDDGQVYDRRLVEIFNRYGIRGTFHLNSGIIGRPGHIGTEEVAALYRGHEVSSHTVNHYDLVKIPASLAAQEILDDRRTLEALCGYPVRGMSYPFGTFDEELVKILPSLGIEYSRTTRTTGNFRLYSDFLTWDGTCHHNNHLLENGKRFLEEPQNGLFKLMYVWGHSYEFERDENWDMIEEFCKATGGRDDVWYATNIEIVDYVHAVRGLRFTADRKLVYNPSSTDVWLKCDAEPVKIPAGATSRL